MTKKRKSDPFSFGNTGFKLPKAVDPFKEVRKNTNSFNKQFNSIKMPKSIMPTYKPMKIDNTLGKMMKESQKQYDRAWREIGKGVNVNIPTIKTPKIQTSHYKPAYTSAYKKITNYDNSFVTKPSSMPSLRDTVNDILTIINKKREEKERRERFMVEKMRENLRNVIKLHEIDTFVTSESGIRYRLEKQMSEISAKVDENAEKIDQVSSDLDLIKERLNNLGDYKKILEDGIAKLIKINSTDIAVVNAMNGLLKEKERTEEEIQQIKTTLEKVVGQQEKDVPFNQSLRKLLDDKRFDDQVL